jgi:hypothetical protein
MGILQKEGRIESIAKFTRLSGFDVSAAPQPAKICRFRLRGSFWRKKAPQRPMKAWGQARTHYEFIDLLDLEKNVDFFSRLVRFRRVNS